MVSVSFGHWLLLKASGGNPDRRELSGSTLIHVCGVAVLIGFAHTGPLAVDLLVLDTADRRDCAGFVSECAFRGAERLSGGDDWAQRGLFRARRGSMRRLSALRPLRGAKTRPIVRVSAL